MQRNFLCKNWELVLPCFVYIAVFCHGWFECEVLMLRLQIQTVSCQVVQAVQVVKSPCLMVRSYEIPSVCVILEASKVTYALHNHSSEMSTCGDCDCHPSMTSIQRGHGCTKPLYLVGCLEYVFP